MLNTTTKHTETDNAEAKAEGNGRTADPGVLLAEMKAQIEDLQRKLSTARGTERNIQAPHETKPDLAVRIEQALRVQICTTDELARVLNEPVARVKEKLKTLRKNLADVGTPEQARWIWRVGDNSSTKELRDVIAKLIEGHKMTTAELSKITGARMPRVNGALVELQRDPAIPIYNLGSNYRAQWLILPKNARPANLPPKAIKTRE